MTVGGGAGRPERRWSGGLEESPIASSRVSVAYLTERRTRGVSVTERDTDAAYSPQEADRIREMVLAPGAQVECPRCGELLTFHGPVTQKGTGKAVLLVRCATYRRQLFVSGRSE